MTSKDARDPVLLLHSGGMSSRQWKKLIGSLSPTHTVLAPDMIGSGDNPPWPAEQEFDWHQDADIIEKLLVDAGKPVHLVGHSYGGLLALTVGRRHPDLVKSLTVYDPVAFGVLYARNDEVGLADFTQLDRVQASLDRAQGGNEVWLEAFIDYWNAPGSWKAMPAPAQDAFRKVARKVFWEAYSLGKDRTPVEAYATITAPALLLTGERTPAAAQRTVRLLSETLRDAREEHISGAGHMGPITHASVVNALIADHIARAS